MQSIELYSDLELPVDHMISNLISNTQPDRILKYKYVYGTWNKTYWTKMFIVPMAMRTVIIQGKQFAHVDGAKIININNKKYIKLRLFMPDLLFVVKNNIDGNDIAQLYVYTIKGPFDPNNTTNIFNAPLPNLYNSGQVCQSGKISIIKLCKDKESQILKNSFDICEYYIDMFMNSAFNNDLDGSFDDTVKKLGFNNSCEYIEIASNPDNIRLIKERIAENKLYIKSFKNMFLKDETFKDVNVDLSIFENDYMKLDPENITTAIRISNDDINNSISIGDNIKYNDDFVKVISFGPMVTSYKLYMNLTSYNKYHYIKYITKDLEIGYINFSEISEKVELGKLILLKNEMDYPINIKKDEFLELGSEYIKIIDVFQIEGNPSKYYLKLAANSDKKYIYQKYSNYMECKDSIYISRISEIFNMPCYYRKDLYITESRKIITFDDEIYDKQYIRDHLIIITCNQIILEEDGLTNTYKLDYFINVNVFDDVHDVENHFLSSDNSLLPCLPDLKYRGDNNSILYGFGLNEETYSKKNIEKCIQDLVSKWNEKGKLENVVIEKKYFGHKYDLEIGKDYFRLPITGLSENDYCDKYIISQFFSDKNKVFVEFQNVSNGELLSLPLHHLLYWYDCVYSTYAAEIFRSENNPDKRFIGKFFEIKKDVDVCDASHNLCTILFKYKIIKIIDVDFTSSDKVNKFFASDNVIYCIDKKIDPLIEIFEKKKKTDFVDHDEKEKIMSDKYRREFYVPTSAYRNDNFIDPKFNHIYLKPKE